MRQIEYKNVLTPSVDYLQTCGTLFLDSKQMAEFLGLQPKVVAQLVSTDRIPLPLRFGLGRSFRWSVLELAEWVEACCPRRGRWIELRGHSGWYPLYMH
jgi:predicted DNA-binding transcriptional regulator AlpA